MTTTRGITGSWLQRWEHWWFRPAPPHAMAVFRIVFSALLFVYWASKLPQIPMAFSREGLVFPSLPDYVPFAFQLLFSPPPLSIAYAVYGCLLLVIVCIGLGWRMRSAAIISFLRLALSSLPRNFETPSPARGWDAPASGRAAPSKIPATAPRHFP